MTQLYQLRCKTHLHAGSGDSNYGVIDKLVQRDPSNGMPCLFSSSLKGAFRVDYTNRFGEEAAKLVFGDSDTGKGKVIFHQGGLLSVPVRSNKFPFFNLTAPAAIDEIIDKLQFLSDENNKGLLNELLSFKTMVQEGKVTVFGRPIAGLKIEDFEGTDIVYSDTLPGENIINIFGTRIALTDDSHFLEMVSDYRLPVIARNNLDNGQSTNLWYEQIIPRESRFFFAVSENAVDTCTEFFENYKKQEIVQIGANATIGYGICEISKI